MDHDDAEEWFESDDGQRWAEEAASAARRAAEDLAKMADATAALALAVDDIRFEREARPDGCSHKLTAELLQRARR